MPYARRFAVLLLFVVVYVVAVRPLRTVVAHHALAPLLAALAPAGLSARPGPGVGVVHLRAATDAAPYRHRAVVPPDVRFLVPFFLLLARGARRAAVQGLALQAACWLAGLAGLILGLRGVAAGYLLFSLFDTYLLPVAGLACVVVAYGRPPAAEPVAQPA